MESDFETFFVAISVSWFGMGWGGLVNRGFLLFHLIVAVRLNIACLKIYFTRSRSHFTALPGWLKRLLRSFKMAAQKLNQITWFNPIKVKSTLCLTSAHLNWHWAKKWDQIGTLWGSRFLETNLASFCFGTFFASPCTICVWVVIFLVVWIMWIKWSQLQIWQRQLMSQFCHYFEHELLQGISKWSPLL